MRLYIVRHGVTEWNKRKVFQGQTDIALAKEGVDLAIQTGIGMRNINIDLCISSPLSRAVETAKLILGQKNTPIITDERIMELSFGDWEGESSAHGGKIPDEYLDLFYTWPLECMAPPNGETFYDVCARTKSFYDEIIRKDEYQNLNILISSHGAASRCLLHALFPESKDIWRGCIPPNCAVTIVDVEKGVGTLVEQDKIFY